MCTIITHAIDTRPYFNRPDLEAIVRNVQYIVLETLTNENTTGADASWRTVVDLNVKAENDRP